MNGNSFQTKSGMGMKFEMNGSGSGNGNELMGMRVDGSIQCILAQLYLLVSSSISFRLSVSPSCCLEDSDIFVAGKRLLVTKTISLSDD